MNNKDTLQYSVNGSFNERIFDIKKAPHNGLWISAYNFGLVYFDKKNSFTITDQNGLVNNFPLFLFEDSFENLWIASNNAEFSRLNENIIYQQPYQHPIIKQSLKEITDYKNGKWIFTFGNGILHQYGNNITNYIYTDSKGNGRFTYPYEGIVDADESVWMGSYTNGIVRLKNNLFITYLFSNYYEHQIVTSVKKDALNNIWFCPTNFGLIKYDHNKFWQYTNQSGLASNTVKKIATDSNKNMYFITDNGFQRIEKNKFQTLYINNHPVQNDITDFLWLNQYNYLIATNDMGIIYIHNDTAYNISTLEGISSNNIKSILKDRNNTIWIATEQSIEYFYTTNSSKINNHKIFSQINGSYISNASVALLDSTGMPYWPSNPNKIIFDERFQVKKIKQPIINFSNFEINGKPIDSSKAVSIMPNEQLKINYSLVYWGRENNIITKYLLVSKRADTTANILSEKGILSLKNLNPGTYKLLIHVQDNNLSFYSNPIHLRVNNFWYNTWVFRILVLTVLILAVLRFFKTKAKKQEALNKLLEIKVSEQTLIIKKEKEDLEESQKIIEKQVSEKSLLIEEINHRVKNNLQFILAMVDMQMSTDVNKDSKNPLLSTSRRINAMALVHEMLYDNKEIQVVSIKKYVTELLANLTELAVNSMQPVELKIEVADLILDARTATSLGIIISELASNSFKHAFYNISAPIISIQLISHIFSTELELSVSDNGNGITRSHTTNQGFGMKMIDIFSRQLAGNYYIKDSGHFSYKLIFKYNYGTENKNTNS